MMLHRMMFSNWCLNILLLSLFASNFFTKDDALHSNASITNQASLHHQSKCSNQAFKASNERNLNKIFQNFKHVFFAFSLSKHDYWTNDWRFHQLVQISNCKDEIWWSLQTQNRVSLNFKLNTFKFQSIQFESMLNICLNASSLMHLLFAEMVDHHFEHEFWHLQDQTQSFMLKFWRIGVNVLLANTLRMRTKLISNLTDTDWFDFCHQCWMLEIDSNLNHQLESHDSELFQWWQACFKCFKTCNDWFLIKLKCPIMRLKDQF